MRLPSQKCKREMPNVDAKHEGAGMWKWEESNKHGNRRATMRNHKSQTMTSNRTKERR